MLIFIAICVAIAAISLVNFILYALDKRAAQRGEWRVPERVLLSLSFFGGAAGGIAGMIFCRHKTRKPLFIAVNALGIIWQAAAIFFAAIDLLP